MLYRLLIFIMIIGCIPLVQPNYTTTESRVQQKYKNQRFIKEKKFNGPLIYSTRKGIGLPAQEIDYLSKRLQGITPYLAPLTNNNTTINHTPLIAAMGSGGGYRAMIGFLGFLEGLEEIGVLDAVSYCAGVSGSTWLLASLYAHQKSPKQHHSYLQEQTAKKFSMTSQELSYVAQAIRNKLTYQQKLTFCDIWGGLISNAIFQGLADGGQQVRLEELAPLVATATVPLPIFTAVLDYRNTYEWVEFTPFEIGSEYLKAWIPSACFGKKFTDGISTDTRPGVTLSYLVGLFASAYALTFPELMKYLHFMILDYFRKDPIFTTNEQRAFYQPIELFENLRFSPPMIRNFTRDMENFPLEQEHYQVLVDAGLDCNLPFVPVLRRSPNLILCSNMSVSVKQDERFCELKKAEEYARLHQLPFPPIDYNNISENEISVFIDHEKIDAPIILYFPCKEEFPTLKFEYTKQEFEKLSGSMKEVVLRQALTIYEAINTAYLRQKQLFERNNALKK